MAMRGQSPSLSELECQVASGSSHVEQHGRSLTVQRQSWVLVFLAVGAVFSVVATIQVSSVLAPAIELFKAECYDHDNGNHSPKRFIEGSLQTQNCASTSKDFENKSNRKQETWLQFVVKTKSCLSRWFAPKLQRGVDHDHQFAPPASHCRDDRSDKLKQQPPQ